MTCVILLLSLLILSVVGLLIRAYTLDIHHQRIRKRLTEDVHDHEDV
jgi:hypothetical protein